MNAKGEPNDMATKTDDKTLTMDETNEMLKTLTAMGKSLNRAPEDESVACRYLRQAAHDAVCAARNALWGYQFAAVDAEPGIAAKAVLLDQMRNGKVLA